MKTTVLSQDYILENFRLSKESIIKNINLILTDRVDQKHQIIAEIGQPGIKTLDDIITAIEKFILENNRPFFSFFSTSRLQRQLSILVDGLKLAKQKDEIKKAEIKKYEKYEQYLQHDKKLDEIIKTILEYSPSRRDVETLKLIRKDFEKVVKKLKTFFSDYENKHSEIETKEGESKSKKEKIDKLLQPIKESGDGIISAFLQLTQLRFYQFVSAGLLNVKKEDRHECNFKDISNTEKRFTPSMFEFNSEREEILKNLFYKLDLNKIGYRGTDKQSMLNATFMFMELIRSGNNESVHFDWLKEKIVLLTNTDANVEDLIRKAESEIVSSSKPCSL